MNEDRMDFQEFADVIQENIRDYLPESYHGAEVKIEEFHKLNNTYMGMQVKTENQTIVPTVNLDAHFQTFQRSGADLSGMDDILRSIANTVQSQLGLDTEWLKDYSQVKDKLYIRVSDAQENSFTLAKSPHKEVDGLAVSCHIAFENGHGIEASTPVTNNMLDMYGITADQLYNDALESSQKLLPPNFVSLGSMMSRMMGVPEEDFIPTMDEPQLMVMTNDQALHGASALFYPGQMDVVAQQLGGNYFVLPSSIHEVLLLPDDGTMDREVLEAMVQDVNMTAVSPEDMLSDHVYHYDAKDHVLEKAETYEHRMEQKKLEAEKASMQESEKGPVKEAGKDVRQGAEKAVSSPGKDPRREPPKKERRSVLARLNEKKEEVKSRPVRDVPSRKKEAAL